MWQRSLVTSLAWGAATASAYADAPATATTTTPTPADEHAGTEAPYPSTDANSDLVPPRPIEFDPSRAGAPPLSARRISGELLAGLGIGIVAAIPSGLLGARIATATCSTDDCRDRQFAGALVGGELGFFAVMPLGVYLAGSIGDQTGSLAATYAGAVIGGGVGFLVSSSTGAFVRNRDTRTLIGGSVRLLSSTAGAIVGFNVSRRYEAKSMYALRITPTVHADRRTTAIGFVGEF